MAASWCKVASNLDSHPKIRKAGRNGREVFLFALRKNADANVDGGGIIPGEMLEPWFIADQLMMPEADAAAGLAACERAGLLVRGTKGWAIAGWDAKEWGRESSTERVRKWREEQKAKRDETLRNVSATDMKRDETHETARSEEIRGEEIRSEERERPSPPAPARASKVIGKLKGCTPEEESQAAEVLERLAARSGRKYGGSAKHVALVISRLRAGYSVWDLRRVIGYCAMELKWEDKPDMQPYLRPETLFGPEAMEKYVYAARAWEPDEQPPEQRTAPEPTLKLVKDSDTTATDDPWREPEWMTATTPR